MYTTIREPVAAVIGSAGARVYSDNLRQGVQRYLQALRASGTINVSVAATEVLNRGSILGAFTYLGLNDGGEDAWKIDARTLGFYNDVLNLSLRSSTRLGGVGVAATPLVEEVALPFVLPAHFGGNPQETVYVQKDPTKRIRLFAELRGDGGQGGIVRGGTSNMSVVPRFTAIDKYDDVTRVPPDFIPLVSEELVTVAAASGALRHDFSQADFDVLRAILLQTDSDQGEVGDIISALRLAVGGRDIIGPAQVPWDDLLRGMESDFGGPVYVTGTGKGQSAYLAILFQESGRLSNTLPANLPNGRFEFNAAPSGSAGVTSSQIRITYIGLKRTAGITKASLNYLAGGRGVPTA